MPGKKKLAKKKVARKGSRPAAEAGAVAKRAPRKSVGQDVVVGEEDFEEEEEEEDEVVAEGNRPAEIVKRALEVGELEEDETVGRWFTDTREAGDLDHGVHGVVVVRWTLSEEDIKGLPELPSSWQDLLLLDVNEQPCVRATGYCRAMAQCALQRHSAGHSARYGSVSLVCNPMS